VRYDIYIYIYIYVIRRLKVKVGGRNSEWYKNCMWMLGMLLRTSDCVSSGVFGVLVDL